MVEGGIRNFKRGDGCGSNEPMTSLTSTLEIEDVCGEIRIKNSM